METGTVQALCSLFGRRGLIDCLVDGLIQPRSVAGVLFCLNRYMTLIQFLVAIFAFHQDWSERVCEAWYRFLPALSVFSVTCEYPLWLSFLFRVECLLITAYPFRAVAECEFFGRIVENNPAWLIQII